jgi:hypothetical protein
LHFEKILSEHKTTTIVEMAEDNIIKYDDEVKKIYFIGNITSFVFYNQLFKALQEHYKKNGVAVAPIFSMKGVKQFESLVVPNLISLGFILKNIYNNPIQLEIERTNATKFLDNGWFFKAVGKKYYFGEEVLDNSQIASTIRQETGYEIYEYEPQMLGFYNNSNVSKLNNSDHRVYVYQDESYNYYREFIQKDVSEEILGRIRTEKYNELKPLINKRYYDILKNLDDTKRRIVLNALREIITNAILYSGSECSAMLQTRNNETQISVSDYGVGFEYSFEKRKERFGGEYKHVFNEFSSDEQEKYKNFLYIFEALHYSKEKSNARNNLYTLLKIVIGKDDNSGITEGVIRIHYNDTQIIMTSNRCSPCGLFSPKSCAKCLLKSYTSTKDISKSNLRFFKSTFRGIHIEIELKF